MDEIHLCPFCLSRAPDLREVDLAQWAVVCPDCGAIGPQHPNESAAVKWWNRVEAFAPQQMEVELL